MGKDTEKENIYNRRKTEKRAGLYGTSSILRRIKSDKRHKERENSRHCAKTVLGTVVVAEGALVVVTGSFAVLLLKDKKQCFLTGTVYAWALLVSPCHWEAALVF